MTTVCPRPTLIQGPVPRWKPHCVAGRRLSEGFVTVPDGRLGARPRWGPMCTSNQATGLPLQVPDVGQEHGATRQLQGRAGSRVFTLAAVVYSEHCWLEKNQDRIYFLLSHLQ